MSSTARIEAFPVPLRPEAIPEPMRKQPSWHLWKAIDKGGSKPRKMPWQAQANAAAKANDPQTWCAFDDALTAYDEATSDYAGLGFSFSGQWWGIDLDNCVSSRHEIAPWALRIVEAFGSYTEYSPSGTGLKIFLHGGADCVFPDGRSTHTKKDMPDGGSLEVYTAGAHRYFTVTGCPVKCYEQLREPPSGAFARVIAPLFKDSSSAGARAQSVTQSLPAASGQTTRPVDPALLGDLAHALTYLDPHMGNQDWVQIGMALHSIGDEGFDLWESWSQPGESYAKGECAKRWASFKIGGGMTHLSIFKAAQDKGWVNPHTPTAEERLIPINAAAIFANFTKRAANDGVMAPVQSEGAGKWRAVDLAGIESSNQPEFEYAVARLIPLSFVTLLNGHGGAGKSTLALASAACVSCGAPFLELPTGAPAKAVYVSLEDGSDMVRYRLSKIIQTLGLDAAVVARNLVVLDGTSGNTELAVEKSECGVRSLQFTERMTELAEHAEGAKMVVVDNTSETFGGNENDRGQVRRFMAGLTRIAKANNCAVLLLAHIDKAAARNGGQGNSYSGSTAWHNSARSRIAIVIDDKGHFLNHEKLNIGQMIKPIRLAFEGPALVRWADCHQTAQEDADRIQCESDAQEVLSAFRHYVAQQEPSGRWVPANSSGPSNTRSALDAEGRFDMSPPRIKAAVALLIRDRVICESTIQNSNRKDRKVYRLADEVVADEV